MDPAQASWALRVMRRYLKEKKLRHRLEHRLRNIEIFLDGMNRLGKGKFVMLDLDYPDNGEDLNG